MQRFVERVFAACEADTALPKVVRHGAGTLRQRASRSPLRGRCGEIALVTLVLKQALAASGVVEEVDDGALDELRVGVMQLYTSLQGALDAGDGKTVDAWLRGDADAAGLLRLALTQVYTAPATIVDVADLAHGFLRSTSGAPNHGALGDAFADFLVKIWAEDPDVFAAPFGAGTYRSKEAITRLAEDGSPTLAAVLRTDTHIERCLPAFRVRRVVCGLWWCDDDAENGDASWGVGGGSGAELLRSAQTGCAAGALTPRGCTADTAVTITPSPILNALVYGAPSFVAAFHRLFFAKTAAAAAAEGDLAAWSTSGDEATAHDTRWLRCALNVLTDASFRELVDSLCAALPAAAEAWDIAHMVCALFAYETTSWDIVPMVCEALEKNDENVMWLLAKAAALRRHVILEVVADYLSPPVLLSLRDAASGVAMLWMDGEDDCQGVCGGDTLTAAERAAAKKARDGQGGMAGPAAWDGTVPHGHPADASTPLPLEYEALRRTHERRNSHLDLSPAAAARGGRKNTLPGGQGRTHRKDRDRDRSKPRGPPRSSPGHTTLESHDSTTATARKSPPRSATPLQSRGPRGAEQQRAQTTGNPGRRARKAELLGETTLGDTTASSVSRHSSGRRVSDLARDELERTRERVVAKQLEASVATARRDVARAKLMTRWEDNRRSVGQRLEDEKRANSRRVRETNSRRRREQLRLQRDLHVLGALSPPVKREEAIDDVGGPPPAITGRAPKYKPRDLAFDSGDESPASTRSPTVHRSPKLSPAAGTRSTYLMESMNEAHGRKHRKPVEEVAPPATRALTPSEQEASAVRLTKYRKAPDFAAKNDKGYVVGDQLVQKYYPREDPVYIKDYGAFLGRITRKPEKKEEPTVQCAVVTSKRKMKESAMRLTRSAEGAAAIDRERAAARQKRLNGFRPKKRRIDDDAQAQLVERLTTPLDKNALHEKPYYVTDDGVYDIYAGSQVNMYEKRQEFQRMGAKRAQRIDWDAHAR